MMVNTHFWILDASIAVTTFDSGAPLLIIGEDVHLHTLTSSDCDALIAAATKCKEILASLEAKNTTTTTNP
jgi:hypothetical protein